MEKKIIDSFLNQHVRIVKDDDFVIWGSIKTICDEGILFFTDGKTIFLSFDRIKEIAPTRREGYNRY